VDQLDYPPLEVEKIGGKLLIVGVGEAEQLEGFKLAPGDEIVSVDGSPVFDYISSEITPFVCFGTPAGTDAFALQWVFRGLQGTAVDIEVKGPIGEPKAVRLHRDSKLSDGTSFSFRTRAQKPLARFEMVGENIVYCELESFNDGEIVEVFEAGFDALDLERVKGFILDVRFNQGGNSSHAWSIISRFIREPIAASAWKSRRYVPVFRAWGRPESWHAGELRSIQAAEDKVFDGPLVVLIGPHTFSAAEDFVVPLDHADRAVLVGRATAGSTGQPLSVTLPGKSRLSVTTKRDTYPDGREFVGYGIKPDVEVVPTQRDIIDGIDRAKLAAVEVINNWGSFR
jgi:C-terminal processing protease CtpA/Prc